MLSVCLLIVWVLHNYVQERREIQTHYVHVIDVKLNLHILTSFFAKNNTACALFTNTDAFLFLPCSR